MLKNKFGKNGKISKKMDAFEIILYAIVSLYVISMIAVLAFGLLNSVKGRIDYARGNIFGLPKQGKPASGFGWRFDNYSLVFDQFFVEIVEDGVPRQVHLMEMFLNSLLYAAGMSLFCMATEIIMAYAIAKYDFRFKKILYGVAVVVMLIPIIGSLASEVQIAELFHFKNSMIGLFIMKCKFPGLYFLVFYATFKGVSWTYAEAAQIDGASHLRIFLEIMLPLVKTTIFAVFILLFIEYWNDYYTPMIFLPDKPTISYALLELQTNNETGMSRNVPAQLASCFLACLPILVVFVIFKNQIMGNVTMGGIKG